MRGNRHSVVVTIDPRIERERLEVLEGLLLALDRHSEVSDTVFSSRDAKEALEGVRRLLGVSEVAGIEILNMQWRRFTRADRQAMQDHVDELRNRT